MLKLAKNLILKFIFSQIITIPIVLDFQQSICISATFVLFPSYCTIFVLLPPSQALHRLIGTSVGNSQSTSESHRKKQTTSKTVKTPLPIETKLYVYHPLLMLACKPSCISTIHKEVGYELTENQEKQDTHIFVWKQDFASRSLWIYMKKKLEHKSNIGYVNAHWLRKCQ